MSVGTRTWFMSQNGRLGMNRYEFKGLLKPIYLVLTVLLIGVVFVSGCTAERGSIATPSEKSAIQTITEEQKQMEILANATHAAVDYMPKNWDADPEDDGILIYPELRDANDETVKFEGVELQVDITIWTTKYDYNLNEVKDRIVYSGTGTIDSWKDGNFLFDGGIKIPFTDIKVLPSDNEFGWVFVKIHTPDGKVYEAKGDVRIKPEPV
jgi:hypothetical protein